MHALAHSGRLKVVQALLKAKDRGLTCQEIPLKLSKATRSHHFEVLRDAGFISCRVQGTSCVTTLRHKELNKRFPGLLKLIASRNKN